MVECISTSDGTIKRKLSVMAVHVSNCTYHDCNRTASIKTSAARFLNETINKNMFFMFRSIFHRFEQYQFFINTLFLINL